MDEQEAAELWILGKNKPDSLCFVGEELTNLRYLRSQEDRINLKLAQSRRINKMQTWRSVLLWWSPTFLSRLPFSFFLRGEENKETCVAGKLICKIIWLSDLSASQQNDQYNLGAYNFWKEKKWVINHQYLGHLLRLNDHIGVIVISVPLCNKSLLLSTAQSQSWIAWLCPAAL